MPNNDDNYTGVETPGILEERLISPSTLETIDAAFYDHMDQKFDIFCDTNKGFRKVPVMWLSAERAFQIKLNKHLRTDSDALIFPSITIERAVVNKSPSRKGIFFGNIPPINDAQGGSITVARRINQTKTKNFADADTFRYAKGGRHQLTFPGKNSKVVYQTISIPMPVYVDITYNVFLTAQYQQQMNQMVAPFIAKPGGINYFLLEKDEHTFESFIQENFAQKNNVTSMGEDERTYQTTVQIKVLGYIIGEGKNQEKPKIVIRENAVEVKIPRERVIGKDLPDQIDKRGFYRD
jgi:hypothetical protein